MLRAKHRWVEEKPDQTIVCITEYWKVSSWEYIKKSLVYTYRIKCKGPQELWWSVFLSFLDRVSSWNSFGCPGSRVVGKAGLYSKKSACIFLSSAGIKEFSYKKKTKPFSIALKCFHCMSNTNVKYKMGCNVACDSIGKLQLKEQL